MHNHSKIELKLYNKIAQTVHEFIYAASTSKFYIGWNISYGLTLAYSLNLNIYKFIHIIIYYPTRSLCCLIQENKNKYMTKFINYRIQSHPYRPIKCTIIKKLTLVLTQKVAWHTKCTLGNHNSSIEVNDPSKSSQKFGKNVAKSSIIFFVCPLTEILDVLGVFIKAGKKKNK